MATVKLTTLALCALHLTLPAQRDDRGKPPDLEHGTFVTDSFRSDALERRSEYGIYLPESYDLEENKDRRYPVAIWLHGMFEDHRRFHVRGGTAVLDRMIFDGELPEMILVTAYGDRSSFYINGEDGKFEDLIAVDLLAHIAEEYRISEERQERAIMGVSMGGYGALKIAFRHPKLFGAVAAHSAALLPRDPEQLDEAFPWLERWGGGQRALAGVFGDPVNREQWESENVLSQAEKLDPDELAGLEIYIDCGDEDRYGFCEPNRELHKILTDQRIGHTWRLVEGGNHGWRTQYNQQAIPHSLRFVAHVWTAAKGSSARGSLPNGTAKKPTPHDDQK